MAATTSKEFEARDPEGDFLHLALKRLNPPRPTPRDSKAYLKAYERMRDAADGDYSGFAVPILFVLSDEDGLQVPWLIEETARAVKGAELARIAGSGHSPHWEQPERYLQVLTTFLNKHHG